VREVHRERVGKQPLVVDDEHAHRGIGGPLRQAVSCYPFGSSLNGSRTKLLLAS
jgi:hypothetical protein